MKLLYCPDCRDVFKLVRSEVRRCKCGKVEGRYLNRRNATVSANAVSLVIGNGSIQDAIGRMRWLKAKRPKSTRGDYKFFSSVTAWVRPNSGPGNPRTVQTKK